MDTWEHEGETLMLRVFPDGSISFMAADGGWMELPPEKVAEVVYVLAHNLNEAGLPTMLDPEREIV